MIDDAERSKLQVGYKQTVRALGEDKAAKVFLAQDCDNHIKSALLSLADEKNIPVALVSTMKELGDICNIEVASSCAVILK